MVMADAPALLSIAITPAGKSKTPVSANKGKCFVIPFLPSDLAGLFKETLIKAFPAGLCCKFTRKPRIGEIYFFRYMNGLACLSKRRNASFWH